MPQGFTDNLSYLPEILKGDLDELSSPQFLFCCDMWMICFFSLLLKFPHRKKKKKTIQLLKLLTLKRHKFIKEKLQLAQTQVRY